MYVFTKTNTTFRTKQIHNDGVEGKNIRRYGKQSFVNFVYFVCASQQNHSLLFFVYFSLSAPVNLGHVEMNVGIKFVELSTSWLRLLIFSRKSTGPTNPPNDSRKNNEDI